MWPSRWTSPCSRTFRQLCLHVVSLRGPASSTTKQLFLHFGYGARQTADSQDLDRELLEIQRQCPGCQAADQLSQDVSFFSALLISVPIIGGHSLLGLRRSGEEIARLHNAITRFESRSITPLPQAAAAGNRWAFWAHCVKSRSARRQIGSLEGRAASKKLCAWFHTKSKRFRSPTSASDRAFMSCRSAGAAFYARLPVLDKSVAGAGALAAASCLQTRLFHFGE